MRYKKLNRKLMFNKMNDFGNSFCKRIIIAIKSCIPTLNILKHPRLWFKNSVNKQMRIFNKQTNKKHISEYSYMLDIKVKY